jgi:hypothetical protein
VQVGEYGLPVFSFGVLLTCGVSQSVHFFITSFARQVVLLFCCMGKLCSRLPRPGKVKKKIRYLQNSSQNM